MYTSITLCYRDKILCIGEDRLHGLYSRAQMGGDGFRGVTVFRKIQNGGHGALHERFSPEHHPDCSLNEELSQSVCVRGCACC